MNNEKNKKINLPKKISIFPLSNVIFFPETDLPLNIFENRYLSMVNDSIRQSRIIGIVQPKKSEKNDKPNLYNIGCIGKITYFNETEDGRILINLSGICRFEIESEIENEKLYREFNVNYKNFSNDIKNKPEIKNQKNLKDFKLKVKNYLEKKGFSLQWNKLDELDPLTLINTIAMISPFSLEEKQSLIETKDFNTRLKVLSDITNIYLFDNFENNTIQ